VRSRTQINERLEAVLSTVPGIDQVHGFARQGQSVIYLSFRWGHNMDLAFLNVREKLDQVQYMLPEQASRPQLIFNTTADEPIAVLAVTARDRPNEDFDTRLLSRGGQNRCCRGGWSRPKGSRRWFR
jgi:hydrophobic/amphiphilic exporter-1 (mainly G- bacteria), HAE1 family